MQKDDATPLQPVSIPQRSASFASLQQKLEASQSCCEKVETRIAHGHPAIEILAASADLEANLIVLGATNRSAFHSLTHDRTVYRVLAHARCPVLTLHETREEMTPLPLEHDVTHL